MSDSNPSLPVPELVQPVELYVVRPHRQRYWLHVLLLLLTFLTTLTVGASLQYKFANDVPVMSDADDSLPLFPVSWIWQEPSNLMLGLPFSLTLLGILLAHEMGHYIYCQKHGVQATLPFFIPAPTLAGTLGAFIRIKSRIHSRAALFDIGIAGPIAGFVVALPVLMVSMALAKPTTPPQPGEITFGMPLVFYLAHWMVRPFTTAGNLSLSQLRMHPTAIAAWVGMFATSLNLLPSGQLDGGHIVYAVAPFRHRWCSRMTSVILIPMALFLWAGWLLWAVLLMVTGMRHPAVPVWPELDPGRRRMAIVAVVLMALTLIPAPFNESLLDIILELFRRAHGALT